MPGGGNRIAATRIGVDVRVKAARGCYSVRLRRGNPDESGSNGGDDKFDVFHDDFPFG